MDGEIPGNATDAFDAHAWVLNASQWNTLYNFAEKTGTRLLMQLNPLGTRFRNNTWDPANTEAFLKYVHSRGQDNESVLIGFQFGNEPFLHNTGDRNPSIVSGKLLVKAASTL